jgi:hypothetical protein
MSSGCWTSSLQCGIAGEENALMERDESVEIRRFSVVSTTKIHCLHSGQRSTMFGDNLMNRERCALIRRHSIGLMRAWMMRQGVDRYQSW